MAKGLEGTRYGFLGTFFLIAGLLAACQVNAVRIDAESKTTPEMLREIETLFTSQTVLRGESRVVDLLRDATDPEDRARLALAHLRLGQSREALRIQEQLLAAEDLGEEEREALSYARALTLLRLGEQENCVLHHAADSCVFPIAEGACHENEEGSRLAAAALRELLRRDPENVTARWLLNLAAMTLGEHPEAVPEAFRIVPESDEPQTSAKPFRNIALETGVAAVGGAGGSIMDDFDGDGHLDLFASSAYPLSGSVGQLRFFRNNGDGTFSDRSSEAGLDGICGGLHLIHADYDNNGFPDVFVLRGGWHMEFGHWPNTLLRNNGDGTFTDTTASAGVLAFHPTQAAAWGDFDNDGHIDLFVGNETGIPEWRRNVAYDTFFQGILIFRRLFFDEVQGHLYRNRGDGTFEDVFPDLGIDILGWVKGVAWGDYDRDGNLDLYISRFAESNRLFRNEGPDEDGDWSFTDTSAIAGVREPKLGFSTWFWDYDNDGWLDLFAAAYPYPDISWPGGGLPVEVSWSPANEIREFIGGRADSDAAQPRLYHNNRDGTFSDVTQEQGLARWMSPMGSNFGDVDNDGFLDVFLGTGAPPFDYIVPNRMFRNEGGAGFREITTAARVGHLQKGHGISFGDIDNDGDQDVYVVLGGAYEGDTFPNALYENPGYGNQWVTLQLVGERANRSAIGARIELVVSGEAGPRKIYRTIVSGGAFGSSSLQQEIGIGESQHIKELTITWPDAERSVECFRDLQPNQCYRIHQGAGLVSRSLTPTRPMTMLQGGP